MREHRARLALLRAIAEAATPLPLIDGETVGQFMDRVQLAAREFVTDTFDERMRSRVVDAEGGRVVIDVWDYSDGRDVDTYIVVEFSRDGAGAFEFGSWSEVRRVTNYVPVIDAERQLAGAAAMVAPMGAAEARLGRVERMADAGELPDGSPVVDALCGEAAHGLIVEIRSRRSGAPVGAVEQHDGARWRVGDTASIRAARRRLEQTDTGRSLLDAAVDATAARRGVDRTRVLAEIANDDPRRLRR